MNGNSAVPPGPKKKRQDLPDFSSRSDKGRDISDDSLEKSSPDDSRSDEKVIVNEQRANKTVNEPSQTAAHTSEGNSSDDEIIDQS